jgi:hypothetical protein
MWPQPGLAQPQWAWQGSLPVLSLTSVWTPMAQGSPSGLEALLHLLRLAQVL